MKLQEFIKDFDIYFRNFLVSKEGECVKILGERIQYIEHIKEVCSHGKRIRPFNTYIFFHGYSESKANIMDFTLAFELIHTMALIHDDWIDHGLMRRSVPTCHIHYNTLIHNKHIADSQAILVGDLCFGWAYEVLAQPIPSIEHNHHLRAQQYFHKMVQEVILGQMLDVDMMRGSETSLHDVETKSYYKTASYTFIKPMLAGAALAGISEHNELKNIEKLGELMGIAFQYRDDLKDMIEQHEDKDTFSDIEEGQQTMFSQFVYMNANPQQISFLKEKMGTKLSQQDKQELTNLFQSVGAFEYGKNRITEMLDEAEHVLSALLCNTDCKTAFYEIIQLLRT